MSCTIENADLVNCCCDTDDCCGTLINELNPPNRIPKHQIVTYAPVDVTPNYDIDFIMSTGINILWTFTDTATRDAVLANVDVAMKVAVM